MKPIKKAKVLDIEIRYLLTGSGPPLVLIMGLTGTIDWWDPQFLDELSSRYSVLAFDNRGAGRTEAPEGKLTMEQFAGDTAGLMDELGIQSANVLGLSMGGMIAQELALHYPEKVEKIALCATNCGYPGSVLPEKEVLKKLADRSGTQEELVRRFLTLLFPEDWLSANQKYFSDFYERYILAPTSDHNAARQFTATTTFSTYERLPSITAPTLIATGSEDVLVPPENSRIIAGRIPGSRRIEFEGAGHGFINQCRGEFLKVLVDFLG